MKFTELSLAGAYLIEPEYIKDERGFFARCFCQEEFRRRGLHSQFEQCNISFNIKKGTLRGMHYQIDAKSEAKLIRCTIGKIFDVVIDLRPHSKTYKQWTSVELSAHTHSMIYIPEGFAHGFQTLEDHTELFYQMSVSYDSQSARGIRWNDPLVGIKWPLAEPLILSLKDQHYPNFEPQ